MCPTIAYNIDTHITDSNKSTCQPGLGACGARLSSPGRLVLSNMIGHACQQLWIAMTGCFMLCPIAHRRIASCEELLPLSHLLPQKPPDVPLHIKQDLQRCLRALPTSAYSPLQHRSGALETVEVSPSY